MIMDFEQELQELITAALEAGVSRDTIISAIEERVAFLTGQEKEEVEDQAYTADD
jgi:hypothetical protein